MSAWRVKTIALVLAGRLPEAAAAAQQLLRLSPQYSVEEFRRRNSSAAEHLKEQFAKALAEAGIPLHS
jgi:hypothetical protein